MNIIPEDIEKLIFNYKYQIEHSKKFKKCLKQIENIKYIINQKTNGINIYCHKSQRDNIFYSIINTDTIHRFISETEGKITTIINYSFGIQFIYHIGEDEVD